MFRKAVQFVATHKLAVAALFLPVVGMAVSAAILAYQERRKPHSGPVRDAVDEPVAPPSVDELERISPPRPVWRH